MGSGYQFQVTASLRASYESGIGFSREFLVMVDSFNILVVDLLSLCAFSLASLWPGCGLHAQDVGHQCNWAGCRQIPFPAQLAGCRP